MIQSHGPSGASFFLIADGGAPSDVETNYALTGSAENELRQIMGTQINIKESWRTCLVKERINANELDSYKDKIDIYKSYLYSEIEELKPHLLIPLGEAGFNLLTGLSGIRKFRGSVVWSTGLQKPIKVLPILGPNPYLYQSYETRWISRIDFSKVHRFLNDGPPPEQNLNIWVATTAGALRNFLTRSYTEDGLLTFDIETFCGIPTCISFCFDGRESVCIPFLDKSIDIENRMLMIQLVARILASPIKKVNQNIKYDWKCLERVNFVVNNVIGDTMLNASILTPEFPRNLGFLNSIYNDIPYFKDEGKEYDPAKHKKEQFYLYNAKDSLSTYQIYEKQCDEIRETGADYVARNISALIPIYKNMENNGLWYDDTKRKDLLNKYDTLFNIQILKLKTLCNRDINPMSPKQCTALIFEELGYKKTRNVQGTGEEELENLMVFGDPKHSPIHGKIILQTIINCRKIHKVIEYLNTIPYPDEKWRCEYNLGGTETGRTTAGKTTDVLFSWVEKKKSINTIQERMGRSFQTIGKHGFMIDGETYGKDLRSIFVPSNGYSFVEIDLSQAEARVDAVLAGNFDILSVFDGPVGIHRLTGSWVFGCDPSEIKKNTQVMDEKTGIACDRYYMAKTVRHAGERNMLANRLVMMTQQPIKVCQTILSTFHEKQPEIREVYHRDVKECIDATRTLRSPNGRSRQFLGRIDWKLYNEAISQLPQSIVGDQCKFSLVPTMAEATYAKLLVEQHDGFMVEVPIGRESEFIGIAKKNVETEIDFSKCSLVRDYKLIIPSEASVSSESWYDLKEIK